MLEIFPAISIIWSHVISFVNLIWVTNIVNLDGDIYICNHLVSDGINRGLIYRQQFTASSSYLNVALIINYKILKAEVEWRLI